MNQETIDGKLLFAKTALENAKNVTPVNASLALFGYDSAKLDEGMALYTTANDLNEKQKKEYGEQFQATDALHVSRAELKALYMRHLKIARIALRGDRGAEESMQMGGRRKETLSGFLKQVNAFYTNALNTQSVQDALARFNITTEALTEGKAKAEEVAANYHKQLKEMGEAQQATEERDEALDALEDWMSDFIAITRIALEGQEQYLEVVGVVEPS
ncbi:hypothetical protein [Ekhidna sp.]|uniref:hypothetical protein n=1 Tax=Ekhidna sp. TaxID=2608089 RepID=UPI003B5A0CCF